jgi:hypothetical protein
MVRESAETIAEFVEWTEQISNLFSPDVDYVDPWFRGIGSSRFHLIPNLYRSDAGREDNSDDVLRSEFKRRALPLVAERPPRDDWEWYSLMQHYGAPTRLLDWTDSALVALYFAISSYRTDRQTGPADEPAVWALNPWKLNQRGEIQIYGPAGTENSNVQRYLPPPFREKDKIPKYPIALDPTFIAQRMLVQHSHFTLHGFDVRGLDEMKEELGLEDALLKVVIHTEDEGIKILRQRIALLGITETTIFPDLGGLGRELSFEYDIL